MTFLNLGKRLQPARKAWKTFTSKFQRSKTITKKPKNRIKASTRKSVFWPSLTFQRRLQLKGRRIQTTHIRHHDCLQRRSKPVYIDELFIKPASMAKPVYIDELFIEPASTEKGKGHIDITEKCSTSVEAGKLISQSANDVPVADDVPGTSKAGMKGQEETDEADDMWESLELASPMMQGIDEKAEEFITRIRAEMQLQEMMARQL